MAAPSAGAMLARLADPTRCPECNAPVPELNRLYSAGCVCRGCGRWELDTGVCILPVAGPVGTPAEYVQLHSPLWRPISPAPPPAGAHALDGADHRQEEPHTDGPDGGRWLWWKNRRHDVPRGTVYRLLAYMWGRDSANYDDLFDAEVFDTVVQPQTVRSYANKANTALPTGFPWRLSADSETRQLTKVPTARGA